MPEYEESRTPSPALGDLLLSALGLILGLAIAYQSMEMPPAARLLPQIFGLALAILCAIQLLRMGKVARTPRDSDRRSEEQPTAVMVDKSTRGAETRRAEIVAWLWFVAFIAAVFTLGLDIGGPLFIVAYMRFEGKLPWKVVLPVAIGLGAILPYLFNELVNVPIYSGLFR